MNICGRSVVRMLNRKAVKPANLLVICDSIDHPPCLLRPKFGGSANGHNGVRSVITALGNNGDFHRLRLGVGRSPDIPDYVLGPLSAEELEFWSPTGLGSKVVWREVTRIVQESFESR